MKTRYTPIFRRRRKGKTNYLKRKSMIISKKTLLCIRTSNKYSSFQFLVPMINGDLMKSTSHSVQLSKFGWTNSGKNTQALYLTGYLAGKKAKLAGIKDAILYSGMRQFTAKSSLIAGLKGVIDAGIDIPADHDIFSKENKFKTETIEKIIKLIDSEYSENNAKKN